jgi:hypothetical protein
MRRPIPVFAYAFAAYSATSLRETPSSKKPLSPKWRQEIDLEINLQTIERQQDDLPAARSHNPASETPPAATADGASPNRGCARET